ncbi:MAG TPA: hypothetical protein VGJ58_09195, partial [Gaiellaceae bacterium]
MARRFTVLTASLLVAAATIGGPARPVRATFPGTNGVIAFVRSVAGGGQIYLVGPNGAGEVQLTRGVANGDPSWSPDGSR